jgi:hypothetical protein
MLEKKLVTLGCAVGILACGACFLPPLPQHEPTPPPVRLDLQGIRKIRVEVSYDSQLHDLDPNALASWIEVRINTDARSAGAKAFSQKHPASADADAVLQVTVLSETATPGRMRSNGVDEDWDFQISISAVLTKKDGRVVWRESDGNYHFSHDFTSLAAAHILSQPELQNWLTLDTGRRLVARMLNAQ